MNEFRQSRNKNQGNQANRTPETNLPAFQSKWIKEGADDEMIKFTDKLGNFLKSKSVSSSQLRNIYGEIMRIKMKKFDELKTDFILLKPKVAYNYGRIKSGKEKEGFKEFVKVFNKAHSLVANEKTFENFHKFFEAILAYHKYYGGK